MYLIIAKYSDDAERKRIEYALEKWGSRMDVTKPEGIVAILDGGEDIKDLLEDLYSRVSKNNIAIYTVDKAVVGVEKEERELNLELVESLGTIEKFIGFMMAKQKAVLKRELKEPLEKIYEVYTKKGKAAITVRLREKHGKIGLNIRITGYGDVVDFLRNRMEDELKYFKEG